MLLLWLKCLFERGISVQYQNNQCNQYIPLAVRFINLFMFHFSTEVLPFWIFGNDPTINFSLVSFFVQYFDFTSSLLKLCHLEHLECDVFYVIFPIFYCIHLFHWIKEQKKHFHEFCRKTGRVVFRLKMVAFKRYGSPNKMSPKMKKIRTKLLLSDKFLSFSMCCLKEHLIKLKRSGWKIAKQ